MVPDAGHYPQSQRPELTRTRCSGSWRRRAALPRAGLTQARVVDEAVDFADEVGLSKLTLAALAKRLGVREPSLYKHVDGMDALQRDIALGQGTSWPTRSPVSPWPVRGEPHVHVHWRTGRGPAQPGCYVASNARRLLATPRPKQPIVLWSRSSSTSWPVTNSVTRMPSTRPAPAGRSARLRHAGTLRWLRTPRRCRPQLRRLVRGLE